MDIDTDREYRIQQLEEFILNHESELSVDGLLVSATRSVSRLN